MSQIVLAAYQIIWLPLVWPPRWQQAPCRPHRRSFAWLFFEPASLASTHAWGGGAYSPCFLHTHYIGKLQVILTADKRNGIQSLPPLLWNLDSFTCFILLLSCHALVVGVRYYFLHVVILHGVCNVPKICALGKSTLRSGIRQEAHESFIWLKNWQEFLNRQLIIVRHVHILDCTEGKQLFFWKTIIFDGSLFLYEKAYTFYENPYFL